MQRQFLHPSLQAFVTSDRLDHIRLYRRVQLNWQAYDAYARVSLFCGANSLKWVSELGCLVLFLGGQHAGVAAICVALIFATIQVMLTKLDLRLRAYHLRRIALLLAFTPFATTADPETPSHLVVKSTMGFARSVSAGATFEPHATALNVIPSRQNLFLPAHRRGGPRAHWLPWEGVYSVGSHDSAELLVSPRHDRWTRKLQEAADGPYRPLLLEEDVRKAGTPVTPRAEHELSLSEAVFNLANTVLGVGVLSIPYAFRLSGYVSILLILVTILVTAQTGVFIGSALQLASRSPQAASVPPRGRDFTFLAHVGFGGRGAALIAFVTSVEVWFALVTFMVMNGVNVSVVFPEVGAGVASATSCALAVVMVFIPMRVYSYLSVVASLALAVAAVALVAADSESK
ncbi:hypothetical protein AK812_SmicGene17059 [Symbiodinium microadriaticum]|uniref:Amino acid transporter transmembrane domain-containing protein n=1 Tax=Symbiodinium microadriaticum TaxID=2951 RepID=A0A1Q9DYQ3_SYMMI|nr:hypothetical protein AK812_SmicGene17059 [Symbiodinium microadriaticum]